MSVEILKKLKDISGTNDKKEYIKKNKDNEEFKFLLNFLLNPYIKTGISTKKLTKKNIKQSDKSFEHLVDLLKYLSENNTGRDVDVAIAQDFLSKTKTEDLEIIKGLITKSLTLGVQSKTVNSVISGLIPEFQPMLATEYSKGIEKINGAYFAITLKLDGVRCLAVKQNGKTTLFSRTGNEFVGIVDVIDDYSIFPDGVYDGELIAIRNKNESTEDLYRRSVGLANSNNEVHGMEHIVFDYIPLNEWLSNVGKTKYSERRAFLTNLFSDFQIKNIRLLETIYVGNDINKIKENLRKVSDEGYEGIMINLIESPYEFKRGKALLKAKEFDSGDLLVKSIVEGQGRLSGKLGNVIVDYKGFDVGVGTGFNDEDRNLFFKQPELIVGKIIRVDYQTESKDKNGNISLRFPSYNGVYNDKTADDIRYSDKDGE